MADLDNIVANGSRGGLRLKVELQRHTARVGADRVAWEQNLGKVTLVCAQGVRTTTKRAMLGCPTSGDKPVLPHP